jgi:hypothetical protein
MARVWQIAGGPWGRSYSTVFLRHGVGLIGPGDPGAWNAGRPDEDFDNSSSVRRFATEPQQGDLVLLRAGNSVVRAVGLIASDYQYLPQFDDVNGWDLQHARRIRWCPLPQDHDFGQSVFGANARRFGKVDLAEVIDFAQRYVNSPPTHWQTAALPPLPPEEEMLDDIPERLRDVVGLAHDFSQQSFGERVSEDEMIVHLIAPLFRALGWLPEQIAVKWRYVDVALFPQLPRKPENCALIVEAKYPGVGAEGALGQAKRYARDLNIRRDILVSDGFRYRLYAVEQDYQPVAYANLIRLKRSALDLFNRLKRP